MEQPSLIEASTKNYLFNTLKQCHNNRINLYYYVFNISVFLIFVAIVGTLLYRRNTNKPTEYQRQQKLVHDQQYVMSKIRYYKEEVVDNENQHITRLTNLPVMQG